jgi:two-component system sensor histidine kinase PhcS
MDANLQQIRRAFKQHDQEATTLINIKVGCVLGMLLVPSFTILDFNVYPLLAHEFLLIRLACSALIGLCLLLLLKGVGRNYYYFWGVSLLLLPSSSIAYMIWRSEGATSPYYAGLNLVLLVLGFVLRWTLWESLFAVLIVAFEYVLACQFHGDFKFKGVVINNFYFLISTGVIVVTGNHIFCQARYREFVARYQLDQNKRELETTNLKLSAQNLALEKANREIKAAEMQLVQSEKMSSLGRFSAGLMHDILNPLNYSRTGVFVLRKKTRRLPPELLTETDAILNDIEDGLKRVDNIVSDLRTFTHPGVQALEGVDLADIFNLSLRFVSSELKDKNIALKLELEPGQKVWASRNHFILVLVNLLENAIDALDEKKFADGAKPAIEISSRVEGERSLLVIRDNGPGIDPQNLAKVFDPFYTTKDVGKGTGLGLSICFGIVRGFGGTISAASEPGQFCEFTLDLPATAEAAAKTKPENAESLRL